MTESQWSDLPDRGFGCRYGLLRRFRVSGIAAEDFQRNGQFFHFAEDIGYFLIFTRTFEVEEKTVIKGIRSQGHRGDPCQVNLVFGKQAQHGV